MRNPFSEKNFKIQTLHGDGGLVVRSDSERFGNNEIVFQGQSYTECLHYIEEKVDNVPLTYYVIKDLACWRSNIWEQPPESSAVERFDTVEEAILRFNEYKSMDYLKETVINPDNGMPMRRLAFGVSYYPAQMRELDLLHTEGEKTLLISDIVGERENGYEGFMVNGKFIQDLNIITSSIVIDEYSYYRDTTLDELANDRLVFLKEHYPDEEHTIEEAMQIVKEFVRRRPDYLKNNKVNVRVPFEEFDAPFLNKDSATMENGITIKKIIDICCFLSNLEGKKDGLEELFYADFNEQMAAYEESPDCDAENESRYDLQGKYQQELNSFLETYSVYISELDVELDKQTLDFVKNMVENTCYERFFYAGEAISRYKIDNLLLNISGTTEVLRNAFWEQIKVVSDTYFSLMEYEEGTSAKVEAEIEKLELICKKINEPYKDISEHCEVNQSEQDTQKVNFMRRRGR